MAVEDADEAALAGKFAVMRQILDERQWRVYLGTEARMNLPGSAVGNWRWRCADGMLTPVVADRLAELTAIYDRSP